MKQTVSIGYQTFREMRDMNFFYVDKSAFIREWWESGEQVTLITRPRRFGKTLNMSMLNCFFSSRYAGRGDLFEGLEIWKDEKYRALQGTLPVISLSFAKVKDCTFSSAMDAILFSLGQAFRQHGYLKNSPNLPLSYKKMLQSAEDSLYAGNEGRASRALLALSEAMAEEQKKGVIILLDEYDAPLQEAWLRGYREEMSSFMRALFNSTFKDNPFLARGVLTGVTRVSKESMFSDLNNLAVSSVLTKGKYETAFGFTEEEVFAAMARYGYRDRRGVKKMYDGFVFGSSHGIYNPWSIIKYLAGGGELKRWWVNTSSNGMVSKFIQEGPSDLRICLVNLMQGKSFETELSENIVFSLLKNNSVAVWSLLVEAGYLKAVSTGKDGRYEVSITNGEVIRMFEGFVNDWFQDVENYRKDFVGAFLRRDIEEMNSLMGDMVRIIASSFDVGKKPSPAKQPERFYHGFVLGLLVDLKNKFAVYSNGESGYGRYDVMLEPLDAKKDDGFILEFKVIDTEEGEADLPDTVASALAQIDKKRYDTKLLNKLPPERIHKYAFAFRGKKVLIDDKSGIGRATYRDKKERLFRMERRAATVRRLPRPRRRRG